MPFPNKSNPKNNSQRDMGTNSADRAKAKAHKGHEKEGLKPGGASLRAYPVMYGPTVLPAGPAPMPVMPGDAACGNKGGASGGGASGGGMGGGGMGGGG